jgi:hypothetical protein
MRMKKEVARFAKFLVYGELQSLPFCNIKLDCNVARIPRNAVVPPRTLVSSVDYTPSFGSLAIIVPGAVNAIKIQISIILLKTMGRLAAKNIRVRPCYTILFFQIREDRSMISLR